MQIFSLRWPWQKAGVIPSPLAEEGEAFLREARELMARRQAVLDADWNFSAGRQWSFGQDDGVFGLALPDGRQLQADGQILGTFSTRGYYWQWAWSNPNVDPAMARDSLLAKQAGERLGIPYLVFAKVKVADKAHLRDLAALGVAAADADGVFQGVAGGIEVWILVRNLRQALLA